MGIYGIGKQGRYPALVISFLVFLISFWIVANAHAQQKTKKNFLWSVKTDKATIYLLGSLHLLKADSYPLDKNIETAYKDCQRVVFEADIDGAKDPEFQSKLLALGFYAEGETLQQNISEETYSLLEKRATAIGITMAQLNPLKPWLCASAISELEFMKMGFDPQYGVDVYFFDTAKKDGKETIFLETLDFQMKLFTELTSNEGDALLIQTLKDLEVIETMLPDIVEAWKNGDAARLGTIMTMSFQDLPNIYNRFVVQRNKAWVGTIEHLVAQGGITLVVVGAGHLVGPDNLLQLLRKKGYTIEQITAHTGVATFSTENLGHALLPRSGMEEQLHTQLLGILVGFDQISEAIRTIAFNKFCKMSM
jgi:uncharacterized protein YbaP (TraB family)